MIAGALAVTVVVVPPLQWMTMTMRLGKWVAVSPSEVGSLGLWQ